MNSRFRLFNQRIPMMRFSWIACLGLAFAGILALAPSSGAGVLAEPAPGINPDLYAGLKWRNVGPFHGGRIAAVAGVISEPGVYYFGAAQGGIWKTTDAGVTWSPIFDQKKQVDSIGAIAVAPTNPNIVYAGTGDPITTGLTGTLGDGMWKSTDAGKTWHHIGLENTVKIDRILIDPSNPNLVIVSALGNKAHHGGGVYRSTNGGKTWTRVLDPKGYDGTREIEYSFNDPKVMLADTQGTNGFRFGKKKSKHKAKPPLVFKSTDEGKTWHQIKIPPLKGRVAVAIANHTHGQRMFIVGQDIENGSGLFRSDDGGKTWQHMAGGDTRISNGQGNYSSGVFVDPQNSNVVYTVSTAMYRSTDGGLSFHAFKGAPGGEDYHKLWIDPKDGHRMIVGADQGASVSLNGGRTWSLWYTEPIAQMYQIATTAQYPYWIVGSQQDTGAVMVKDRSKWGQVDFTDWSPVPSSEFGVITPDPLHPNILYGVGYGPGGGGSGMTKINMRTGQWENVAPNFGVNSRKYRESRTAPKAFDTKFDPHALYAAYQCLLVSHNGGHSWKAFSPDLTTAKGKPRVPCGKPLPKKKTKKKSSNPFGPHGPVINSFSISKAKKGIFWTVSSNNQIYKTVDGGKHWVNESNIVGAPAHTKLQSIVAGDKPGTAYVTARISARHGFRSVAPAHEDADVPLIWRTTNGGETWTPIVDGLPKDQRTGSWVNVLRADPKQPGLLFAGTETTVYVSFDNGAHWQSLRQNLPSTSIRDMVVHTAYHRNDLVICTYGRGVWVLDDITPLRQIAAHAQKIASSGVYFFKPQEAIRSRQNSNWDQPFSVEMPHAHNPPYGVVMDYYLRKKPKGPIKLQIFDSQGNLVRTLSSKLPAPIKHQAYPRYWVASPKSRALSTHVGLNRFSWNLRYAPPPAFQHDLENQMNTVAGTVTPGPHGPQVIPGVYTLKLSVDGHDYTRHVTVMNDPRVGQSPKVMAELKTQQRLTMLAYRGMQQSYEGRQEVKAVREELATLLDSSIPGDVATKAKALKKRLTKIGGGKPATGILAYFESHRPLKPNALRSFLKLNNKFNTLVSMMQVGYDMSPTPTQIATWKSDCKYYDKTLAAWKSMQKKQLTDFNKLLSKNDLPGLSLESVDLDSHACHFATGSKK